MKKDLLSYLFGDSQVESEIDETRSTIERIMEEAEEQEPLKVKQTPLANALKALGLTDLDSKLEMDPEGFSLRFEDELNYKRCVKILMDPESMEKLAELGWVVTRLGDVAMANEPAEFRIRFLEIHFVNDNEIGDVEYGGWPAPNNALMTDVIKKGREFATTPMDHEDNKLDPVEFDDKTSSDRQKGVGDAKDGADPEGKPKTGKSKGTPAAESLSLVDQLLSSPIDEGGHKPGCECGFCKNKGSYGKKKDMGSEEHHKSDEGGDDDKDGGVSMPGGNMGEAYNDPVTYVDKGGKARSAMWVRRGKAPMKKPMGEAEPERFDDVKLESKKRKRH